MYFGVLAVGISCALIARLQPHGMARALFATALAQALVATIAHLWLTSAWLFWKAARGENHAATL
jgi:hypothetical protein